jgi:hypothetical protein
MEKKTIIIISLLSAVFSLIYILLNYFGLIRYLYMYIYPIEGYINKYKNLDQINKENKVIISLIATDKQLENITHVIKSLLDQTVRVDLISIIIPQTNNYVLPKNLSKTVAIYKGCDEKAKTGNLNCLLSTIAREGEITSKIITLGADVIYGKDFIETILDTSEKNPDSVVYVNSGKNNYIELEKGAVFSIGFFEKDFMDIPSDVHANEWVNNYINNKGIKKVKVNYNENYKKL